MKRLPEAVAKFVNNTKEFTGQEYVEMLDTLNGKVCTRLFAYKHTKTYGVECKEIYRAFIKQNYVSGSLWCSRMAGYQVVWGRKKKSCSYFQNQEPDDKFYKTDIGWRPLVEKSCLYTNKQAVELLKGEIPYFEISDNTNIYDLMEYARTYIKRPQLELLAKNGFSYLYCEKRLFNLGVEKTKAIYKWLKENRLYTLENKPCYNFIREAIKLGYTGEEMREFNEIAEIQRQLQLVLLVNWGLGKEINKYLKKQNCDATIYKDYLEASKKLNRDIENRGVLFPHNLMDQHDSVIKLVSDKKNKALNKKLKNVYATLKNYVCKKGEFEIVIPQKQSDLVMWGNKLHNCVGTLNYGERMGDGECIIIGVFLNNKIIECCELNKQHEIEQLRGDHNGESEYHKDCLALVNKFRRKLNYANC